MRTDRGMTAMMTRGGGSALLMEDEDERKRRKREKSRFLVLGAASRAFGREGLLHASL